MSDHRDRVYDASADSQPLEIQRHQRYDQLLRWAKRRHPKKTAAWRRHKYFSAAARKGHFSVRLTKGGGTSQVVVLYEAASTVIRRHVKIIGAANPYDPHYTQYFEQRRRFNWWRQRGVK